MEPLIWVVIAVFAVFAVIAVVFIVKATSSAKSRSDIHISGGANIDSGYLSDDNNYFKGGYNEVGETVVMNVNYKKQETQVVTIKLTNLKTHAVYTLNISQPIVVGRAPGSGQFEIKDDRAVSKMHCRFYLYRGYVYVQDLNSSNHTYVNSNIIDSPYKLNTNDVIKVGSTLLKIEI